MITVSVGLTWEGGGAEKEWDSKRTKRDRESENRRNRDRDFPVAIAYDIYITGPAKEGKYDTKKLS